MKDIKFLEDITTIPGGSGDEGLVRNLLKEEISKEGRKTILAGG